MAALMFAVCALLCLALGGAQAVHHDTVDAAERARVIGQVLDKLHESYISEQVAQKVEKEIRDREKAGGYDGLSSAAQFTQALTRDLQVATGDKHLIVRPADEPIAAGPRGCAFVNVGVLTGNIGYI